MIGIALVVFLGSCVSENNVDMKHKDLIRILNHNVEHEILGSAEPVIVLLNGLQMPMTSWSKLTPLLRDAGTVVLYNRLGVGASDRPSESQDGRAIASQLNSMLSELSLRAPVILVGHSMGGLYANLYARLNPEKVLGVVFLEATHPSEPAFHKANIGIIGKTLGKLPTFSKYSPVDDPNSEGNSISSTVRQIADAPSFPSVPLLVISAGKNLPFIPKFSFEHHLEMQKELVKLAPKAIHLTAEKSSHFPQMSEPEFVADAIVTFITSL